MQGCISPRDITPFLTMKNCFTLLTFKQFLVLFVHLIFPLYTTAWMRFSLATWLKQGIWQAFKNSAGMVLFWYLRMALSFSAVRFFDQPVSPPSFHRAFFPSTIKDIIEFQNPQHRLVSSTLAYQPRPFPVPRQRLEGVGGWRTLQVWHSSPPAWMQRRSDWSSDEGLPCHGNGL